MGLLYLVSWVLKWLVGVVVLHLLDNIWRGVALCKVPLILTSRQMTVNCG